MSQWSQCPSRQDSEFSPPNVLSEKKKKQQHHSYIKLEDIFPAEVWGEGVKARDTLEGGRRLSWEAEATPRSGAQPLCACVSFEMPRLLRAAPGHRALSEQPGKSKRI